MPSPPTWPPPPDVPHPLAEHDGFLTACVLRSSEKPTLTRLRLVQDLRKERGLDFRQSRAIVDDYCNRHAILMPLRSVEVWGVRLSSVVAYIALLTVIGSAWLSDRLLAVRLSYTEQTLILNERANIGFVCAGIIVVSMCLTIIFAVRLSRKRCIDAEDARKKLAA